MKRLLVLGLAALICMSAAIAQRTQARDGVFIHISSNDPHRVVMALSMALKMSEDKDVLIYCDIKGIDVVLKDAPDVEYPTFSSAQTSLKKLLAKGITVFACPACMKAAGKTAETAGLVFTEQSIFTWKRATSLPSANR
ncbi:MAG: DsrE family protein [Desulfobulbaceae bacterium]|nr:DsrE family protein [Desulfobulbaceae bacterium]